LRMQFKIMTRVNTIRVMMQVKTTTMEEITAEEETMAEVMMEEEASNGRNA